MSNNKPYTSSLPDVAAKQRERAMVAIREQLPLIVEALLEDPEQLGKIRDAILHTGDAAEKLAEEVAAKLGTKKMKITNTSDDDNSKNS